jgi:conjugal transfer pilus assembly protein TraU
MRRCRIYLLYLFLLASSSLMAKEGKFINPITDICWECVFPITVSGINVTPGYKDPIKYRLKGCVCGGVPPKVGIPITFWEPTRLVDVTRHAYKLLGLGGIKIGKETVKNRGSVGYADGDTTRTSFYHVHWYVYPVFHWLEVLTDFICLEKGSIDVGYITELDPLWNDDQLSVVINAEAALFSNPLAQLACIADCTSANLNKPMDKLFWCAGCEGSLYPFTGTVPHHVGAVQASSLLVHRMIAKLHRSYLLRGFDERNFCEARFMPVIKKSNYKTQLVFPIPQTVGPCNMLGRSDIIWGTGKSYPYGGEDFVYLVWRKKQCCLDVLRVGAAVTTAGAL